MVVVIYSKVAGLCQSLALLSLLIGLAVCSSGRTPVAASADTSASTSTDTQTPSVSSVFPAMGSTGVSYSSLVTAMFSEDMFATTIDASSFTLNRASS